MGIHSNFTLLFLIFLLFLHIRSFQAKADVGYTTRYIRRDSKLSPLYNPSLTKSQRSKNAIARSHARYSQIKAVHSLAASPPTNVNTTTETDGGEYLMSVYLGSQKVPLWLIADTGSVLGWTTCNINQITYGDNSQTGGVLGDDTLYFPTNLNGTVSLPSFVFGCSSYYNGSDVSSPTGLIGLGFDPVSLPNQLGVSTFSYCLPGSDVSSSYGSINFGSTGVVTGSNVYEATLFTSSSNIFYFLNLTGITLNGVLYSTNYTTSPGNMIIDSGTTLTYLPTPSLANAVNAALEMYITCPRATSYETDNGLAPCYQAGPCFVAPPIVAHFQGTDIPLTLSNAFFEVDTNVYCSAFMNDSGTDFGIWGNVAQSDFEVGYDIGNQVVNFKRTQCAASS